ncbi:MAG: phasin family protein [Stellaceae bacterium]
MAKGAKVARARQPAATPPAPPFDALFTINGNAFDRWIKGMMEISQEIAQFTQIRLEEDAAAWMKLASCRTPNEAFDCQQRFFERASGEYLAETNRLTQLIMSLASGKVPPAEHASTPS